MNSDLLILIVENWQIIIFAHIVVIAVYFVIANLAIIVLKVDEDRNEEFEEYLETFAKKVVDSKAKNLPRLIRKEMREEHRFSKTLPRIISSQSKTNSFINYLDKYIAREKRAYLLNLASLPFMLLADIFVLHTELKYWIILFFLFTYRTTWIKPMKKLIGYEFLSTFLKEI